VLFGDGAGAMVLTSTEATEEGGILGYEMHSDGTGYCNLQVSCLSSALGSFPHFFLPPSLPPLFWMVRAIVTYR